MTLADGAVIFDAALNVRDLDAQYNIALPEDPAYATVGWAGVAYGFVGMSARGVGYLILQAEGAFDINTVFAGILVLTLCALLLDFVVMFAENKLLKWRPQQAETETT